MNQGRVSTRKPPDSGLTKSPKDSCAEETSNLNIEQLRNKYLNVKAKHTKQGEGVISLTGLTGEGQVWIEVNFGERRRVFVEPFENLTIEGAPTV